MTQDIISLKILSCKRARTAIYNRLMAENLATSLLYDHEPNLITFLKITSPAKAWCGQVCINNEVAGLFWINGFIGRLAYLHFAVFRGFAPYAVLMGKYVVSWAFLRGELSCLLGVTPLPYRHVLKIISDVGFEKLGVVPKACNLVRYGKFVDGVASILTPKRLQEIL